MCMELGWLGGRDSNPDTVVQSHVSYRWTTSQCQSRRVRAAGNSDYSRRVRHRANVTGSRRCPSSARRRPDPATTNSPTTPTAAVAAASADGWPSRPSARPPAPPRSLLVGGLATFAGDLALLVAVHRRESAILFCHCFLPPELTRRPGLLAPGALANTRAATAMPRI